MFFFIYSEPSPWHYKDIHFIMGFMQFIHHKISSILINMRFIESDCKSNGKIVFKKIYCSESEKISKFAYKLQKKFLNDLVVFTLN